MNGDAAQRWCAGICLFTAVGTALAHLPAEQVPPTWLLAFVVPAAVLGFSSRRLGSPLRQAWLGLLLQLGACWVAYALAGTLDRKAALACTILPPMAFVTVRRQEADAALGLFLSFCTLLVGVILSRASVPLLGLYVVAATIVLRCDARSQTLARRQRAAPRAPSRAGAPLASGLLLAVCCGAVSFAVARSLELLPSPSQERPAARRQAGGPRATGLSERFVLDGGGQLVDLEGERLLLVTARDGPVPGDLYLRSGFFDIAGLDAWGLRPFAGRRRDAPDRDLRLREPLASVASTTLDIARLADARSFVFVPPGTHTIRGIDAVETDAFREWLRQQPGSAAAAYEVQYQDPPPSPGNVVDPRAAANGLLELPRDLDRAPFERLLAEWQPEGSPVAVAQRIVACLQARCSYRREEPTGPHRSGVLNFLFAEQDRHGYCMHFASAAALLLRVAGVPCRIGIGLFGGDIDPDSRGGRVFGSQHAHAWVEIPFEGRGFTVVDPTPPRQRGAHSPATMPEDPPASPTDAGGGGPAASGLARRAVDLVAQPWTWLALLALVPLLTLRPARRQIRSATPGEREARPARKLLVQILRELELAGLPRGRGQTLEHYLEQPQLHGAPAVLRAAFTVYQEIRFGGRPWNAGSRACMADGLAAATRLRREGISARS